MSLNEAFPKLSTKIFEVIVSMQQAKGAAETFKVALKGIGTVMEANPFLTVATAIGAVIGAVKILDYLMDRVNDSTEDLLAKKDEIDKNINDIDSEISQIDEQIKSLKEQEYKNSTRKDFCII